MRLAPIQGLFAMACLAFPCAASAQFGPLTQTGSHLREVPRPVDPAVLAQVRKQVARCVAQRAPNRSMAVLENSDFSTVDLRAADIDNPAKQLFLSVCLGDEVKEQGLLLTWKLPDAALRDLLAEEFYLASNPVPPTLPAPTADLPLLELRYVSTGKDLESAQRMTRFTDCAILKDVAAADALLRTKPGSDEEFEAARSLAPNLGSCLQQGHKIAFNARSVRSFVAFAMWTRFARGGTK